MQDVKFKFASIVKLDYPSQRPKIRSLHGIIELVVYYETPLVFNTITKQREKE